MSVGKAGRMRARTECAQCVKLSKRHDCAKWVFPGVLPLGHIPWVMLTTPFWPHLGHPLGSMHPFLQPPLFFSPPPRLWKVYLLKPDSTGVRCSWKWIRSVTGEQNPEHTMTGAQRFVISARVIGAVLRHTPKLKVGSSKLYQRYSWWPGAFLCCSH